MVLAVRDGKPCIRRFKKITERDYVAGVVVASNWNLRTPYTERDFAVEVKEK